MYTKATFARQLKSLIESKGLNQRILADRINTTEATISRYTAGVRTPTIETAVEIAQVLGVSMDTLVGIEPPAAQRQAPDITVLIECYSKASLADRQVLWALLDRYMAPAQRTLITTIQAEEKDEAI